MIKKVTLYDRAKVDLQTVRLILAQNGSDELFIDVAAYHVQQGIEKLVKFALSINGIKYKQTHDMAALHEQLEDAEIKIFPWLSENTDTLNSYATKTRYGSDIIATAKKITQLLKHAEDTLPSLQPTCIDDESVKPRSLS